LDDQHWYTVSCTIRIQEIENYGQTGERRLPPDEGHGYIWRAGGFSHFEERDGGVYIEEEVIVLSRDLPSALRWVAGPIIRRVAKETLATSLSNTRIAAVAKAKETSVAIKISKPLP